LNDRPVSVVVWQIRAIYEATVGRQRVTRLEYANGDTLDASENITAILGRFCEAAIH
jgi:hypothetical protein